MTQCARQAGTDSKIANSRLSFFFKLMMVVSERVKTLCVCVCVYLFVCVCVIYVCVKECALKHVLSVVWTKGLGEGGQGVWTKGKGEGG